MVVPPLVPPPVVAVAAPPAAAVSVGAAAAAVVLVGAAAAAGVSVAAAGGAAPVVAVAGTAVASAPQALSTSEQMTSSTKGSVHFEDFAIVTFLQSALREAASSTASALLDYDSWNLLSKSGECTACTSLPSRVGPASVAA
jgi:hypothetical protein